MTAQYQYSDEDWSTCFERLHLHIPLTDEMRGSLQRYVEQLHRWNQPYHLLGPAALPDLLTRHIVDSASLWSLLPESCIIADIGSGAGLPGMVLAILSTPDRQFHLFEANQKKARFLNFVVSELKLSNRVAVHKVRVEESKNFLGIFDVTICRAVANLESVARLTRSLLKLEGVCLAMKGKRVQGELTQFSHGKQARYFLTPVVHPSNFGGEGVIVELRYVSRETGEGT
ncbi:MAG: 16S rRNA (guanine(527)-N(7))-methyltransferase RsmG [Magnetococcus sp. YQC-9]